MLSAALVLLYLSVSVTVVALLAVIVAAAATRIVRVPYGHACFVDAGATMRRLDAGVHVLGLLERVRHTDWNRPEEKSDGTVADVKHVMCYIPLSTLVYDAPGFDCYSKDGVEVEINFTTKYNIVDAGAALFQHGDIYVTLYNNLQAATFTTAADYTANELLRSRGALETDIMKALRALPACIVVTSIEIQSVLVPAVLSEATQAGIAAERRLTTEHAAALADAKSQAERQRLQHENNLAATRAQLEEARLQAEIDAVKAKSLRDARIAHYEYLATAYKAMRDAGIASSDIVGLEYCSALVAAAHAGKSISLARHVAGLPLQVDFKE